MKFDYELIDSGDACRLERFGKNTIVRPESIATWKASLSKSKWRFDAACQKGSGGKLLWEKKESFVEDWQIACEDLKFELRFSHSKNIGIFPEQVSNWEWLRGIVGAIHELPLRVLNLFAYTGAATLVMAQAGAQVCHVDASKSAVTWAARNRELSGLQEKPIRFIVEDSAKFVSREIRRGNFYDALVLDPPAFGKGNKKEFFKFEENIRELLNLCKQLLPERPRFVLLNSYTVGLRPEEVVGLLQEFFPQEKIESGELVLRPKKVGHDLPCSVYARFSNP